MNKVNHLETIFASDQSWRESPNKDINLDLPPDLFTSRSTNPKGRNLQNTNRRRAITNSPVARMKGDKGCNEHDNIVSLLVPFFIVKRGGRKEIQMPDGIARPGRVDTTLIKALARALGLAGSSLAAQAQGQCDDPFRPRFAIRKPRVAEVPQPAQSGRQHEPEMKLP